MKWPWQKIVQPDRATLTLLPDGRSVLGVPIGTRQDAVKDIEWAVDVWLRESGRRLLVLPFPVDIVDRRP